MANLGEPWKDEGGIESLARSMTAALGSMALTVPEVPEGVPRQPARRRRGTTGHDRPGGTELRTRDRAMAQYPRPVHFSSSSATRPLKPRCD